MKKYNHATHSLVIHPIPIHNVISNVGCYDRPLNLGHYYQTQAQGLTSRTSSSSAAASYHTHMASPTPPLHTTAPPSPSFAAPIHDTPTTQPTQGGGGDVVMGVGSGSGSGSGERASAHGYQIEHTHLDMTVDFARNHIDAVAELTIGVCVCMCVLGMLCECVNV